MDSSDMGRSLFWSTSRTSRALERMGMKYRRLVEVLGKERPQANIMAVISSSFQSGNGKCALKPGSRITRHRACVAFLSIVADALDVPALAERRQRFLGQAARPAPFAHQRPNVKPEPLAQALLRLHQAALVLQGGEP